MVRPGALVVFRLPTGPDLEMGHGGGGDADDDETVPSACEGPLQQRSLLGYCLDILPTTCYLTRVQEVRRTVFLGSGALLSSNFTEALYKSP